eukprot:GEMP01056370.1.p1 GENE.GEMP01056370.1~~GEMP01056370.1.p1  ORF type:complete len:153 (+),score=23.15 GEMP01056370.1:257-715(+)
MGLTTSMNQCFSNNCPAVYTNDELRVRKVKKDSIGLSIEVFDAMESDIPDEARAIGIPHYIDMRRDQEQYMDGCLDKSQLFSPKMPCTVPRLYLSSLSLLKRDHLGFSPWHAPLPAPEWGLHISQAYRCGDSDSDTFEGFHQVDPSLDDMVA